MVCPPAWLACPASLIFQDYKLQAFQVIGGLHWAKRGYPCQAVAAMSHLYITYATLSCSKILEG